MKHTHLLTALASVMFLAVHASAEMRILFTAETNGFFQLHTMKADGTDLVQLTTLPLHKSAPALDPTTNFVATVDPLLPSGNILVTPLSGGPGMPIAIAGKATAVQWADPVTIYYLKQVSVAAPQTQFELWQVGTDGSGEAQVYTNLYICWTMGAEAFQVSPTHGSVHLSSFDVGMQSLILTGAIGGPAHAGALPVRPPQDGNSDHYAPAVSPDGLRMAYCADFGTGGHSLYVGTYAATTTATLVSGTYCGNPAWSPDGQWLAYTRAGASTFGATAYVGDIFRANPNGSGETNLTFTMPLSGKMAYPTVYEAPAAPVIDPPTVINRPDQNMVFPSSATLFGQVTSTGGAPTRVFCLWGTADGGASTGAWDFAAPVTLEPTMMVSNAVPITPGVPYYYTYYAVNEGGEDYAIPSEIFGYAKATTVPFLETFETNPPTMAGAAGLLAYQNGWTADPARSAEVQGTNVHDGKHAVAIRNGSITQTFTDSRGAVWTEIFAKPVPSGMPNSLPVDATAVFWIDTNHRVAAFDGALLRAVPDMTVDPSQWTRFVSFSDYSTKTWSLWVNGTNAISRFAFRSGALDGFQALTIKEGSSEASSHADDIMVDTVSPGSLLTDSDGDGMDDTWERENFDRSLARADDKSDGDIDGFNDRAEFIAGTDPANDGSLLQITGIRKPNDTEVVVTFDSVDTRSYTIDMVPLLSTNWLPVFTNQPVPGQAGRTTVTATVDQAAQELYLRVRTRLPK